MKKTISIYYLAFLLIIGLGSCKSNSSIQEDVNYVVRNDTVYFRNNKLDTRISITQANEETHVREVITAGTVQAIPTRFAYIAPPFAGRVVRSYIELGQKVNVNTPLFEIVSSDFTSAQKEFFQARSEREFARKDLNRKKDLLENGVGSQKELEEAINLLEIVEKEYENALAALQVYHVDPHNMVLGEPLIIRSPIAGDVIENNLITGQYLTGDSEHVAIVADLSKVWVAAQVKEKDIRYIHMEDEMNIEIAALPGQVIKGKVFHIDEQIDEDTRSVKVLSICENEDELLKLGMYATVSFIDKPETKVVVPEKAILQAEEYSYVFTQVESGKFVKTPVEIEVTKEGKAILLSGLNPGDKIIGEGGYYLK